MGGVITTELAHYGEEYKDAASRAEDARAGLVWKIREAVDGGMSESEVARVAGVTRMTVRKALGK